MARLFVGFWRQALAQFLAIGFGVVVSLTLVGFVEVFCQLNLHYGWLKGFSPAKLTAPTDPRFLERFETPRFDYLQSLSDPLDRGASLNPKRIHYELYPEGQFTPFGTLKPGLYREVALDQDTGQQVYTYDFQIDFHGRRLGQAPELNSQRSKFMLFYGCSYTFGKGVSSQDTLPAHIQRANPQVVSYNMGRSGNGPNSLLAFLRNDQDPMHQGVTESQGSAVYLYIDDHLPRVLGSSSWLARHPANIFERHFELENGELRETGEFAHRGFLNSLLLAFGQSGFANFFAIDLPIYSENHFRLFAKVVDEIFVEIRKRFNIENSIIVVYPDNGFWLPFWKPFLQNQQIQILDYQNLRLWETLKHNDIILGEGHPTGMAYRLLADLITEDIAALKHR